MGGGHLGHVVVGQSVSGHGLYIHGLHTGQPNWLVSSVLNPMINPIHKNAMTKLISFLNIFSLYIHVANFHVLIIN